MVIMDWTPLQVKWSFPKLEIFQKKLLKQLLSLPQNAPDSAIYLLTEFLPVEAQIHKKALQLSLTLQIKVKNLLRNG